MNCKIPEVLFWVTPFRSKTGVIAVPSVNVWATGEFVANPKLPVDVMRSLSLPPVSAVIVSASGNLIAVSISPEWRSLSAIFNPAESTRTLSEPPVSIVTISSPANLIAVSVSPKWIILSGILTSPLNVPTPATSNIPVLTLSVAAIPVSEEPSPPVSYTHLTLPTTPYV